MSIEHIVVNVLSRLVLTQKLKLQFVSKQWQQLMLEIIKTQRSLITVGDRNSAHTFMKKQLCKYHKFRTIDYLEHLNLYWFQWKVEFWYGIFDMMPNIEFIQIEAWHDPSKFDQCDFLLYFSEFLELMITKYQRTLKCIAIDGNDYRWQTKVSLPELRHFHVDYLETNDLISIFKNLKLESINCELCEDDNNEDWQFDWSLVPGNMRRLWFEDSEVKIRSSLLQPALRLNLKLEKLATLTIDADSKGFHLPFPKLKKLKAVIDSEDPDNAFKCLTDILRTSALLYLHLTVVTSVEPSREALEELSRACGELTALDIGFSNSGRKTKWQDVLIDLICEGNYFTKLRNLKIDAPVGKNAMTKVNSINFAKVTSFRVREPSV
jgi:hypothetical protein